jgi:hypothetical protein
MQSGIVPPLVPFAQTFAAVITAALTGTLYYIATAPKGDPCSTDGSPSLHEYVNFFCFFFGWIESTILILKSINNLYI